MQADFAHRLREADHLYLRPALAETVAALSIPALDAELAIFASETGLSSLAKAGLRGELVYPLPVVLRHNPQLLAYYRMVLGYSQKEFYGRATGLSAFRGMEQKGRTSPSCRPRLPELCTLLSTSADYLVGALHSSHLTTTGIERLALLTLGPQLRGGANNRRGADAIGQVFDIIRTIAAPSADQVTDQQVHLTNAADRQVVIQVASDPDLVIIEKVSDQTLRKLVAIEVKGGIDVSNIHNRLGEAEKSHQKAKHDGFLECWTVYNVPTLDIQTARRESPTTGRFYLLSDLLKEEGEGYVGFREQVVAITGIAQ